MRLGKFTARGISTNGNCKHKQAIITFHLNSSFWPRYLKERRKFSKHFRIIKLGHIIMPNVKNMQIHSNTSPKPDIMYWAQWCSGNALIPVLRGAVFESPSGHRLFSKRFMVVFLYFQANTWLVSHIRPPVLHSKSFSTHYSSIVLPFDATPFRYRQNRINHKKKE